MTTAHSWADATLRLSDSGEPPTSLPGFADLETGLYLLTHPLKGYYTRRDGRLGSYAIWHDRLQLTQATAEHAEFHLLDSLDLVPLGDRSQIHSVLIQPSTEFTIYLPPHLA